MADLTSGQDVDILSMPDEGQQTMANSISVAIASDQTAVATTIDGSSIVQTEDAAHSTGDKGVMTLSVRDDTTPAALSGTDGDYEPLHTDGNGNLWVSLGTQLSSSEDEVAAVGNAAHDAADSGNPVKFGGRAQSPTAAVDEVADNDRVDALFDRQGRLANWMGYDVKSADINDSTSGNNTIVAAAGAGIRIAVLGCMIISDGTVDVRWEDGASGTAKTGQIPLQAREGFVMPIGPQPWFVGSANTLLNLELSAAVNVHGIVSYVEMTD